MERYSGLGGKGDGGSGITLNNERFLLQKLPFMLEVSVINMGLLL